MKKKALKKSLPPNAEKNRRRKLGRAELPQRSSKSAKTTVLQKGKSALGHLFPVAGIGASAGGLEAFTQLLKHLPADTGIAFVLVQHLAPTHESELPQLLGRTTTMPTQEVRNNLRVEPNHVYVIPPNTNMAIVNGVLKLSARNNIPVQRSIDFFFESLALDQKECAIGVILSGTATDGTVGLEAIKAEGGITFAQDSSAKYDSMPRNAIAAGCVDFVLSPNDIAKELAHISKHPYLTTKTLLEVEKKRRSVMEHQADQASLASAGRGTSSSEGKRSQEAMDQRSLAAPGENAFQDILKILHRHSGVDFSLYKSNTIQRRIGRRMALKKISSLKEYTQHLRSDATERDALYSDVLINVTSFFRNPEAFEVLEKKVIPGILRERGDTVRVWVLGCSTGQEAYSLAMILEEQLDHIHRAPQIQIFATDLNEALLEKARAGLYAKALVTDISPARLRRFFVEEDGGYRIVKSLREKVIFARQNLIQDPPFSRMDLISCRNLLIYLDAELQRKIIPTFHYALKPNGFLFLGASESIGPYEELFRPCDRKQKIYVKKSALPPPLRLSFAPRHPAEKEKPIKKQPSLPEGFYPEVNAQREADRIMLKRFVPPGVLINSEFEVLQFRGDSSGFLRMPTGKASFNLPQLARDEIILPLRAALKQARTQNNTVRREGVRLRVNGTERTINIEVLPLKNLKERCYLVFFEESTRRGTGAPLPAAPGNGPATSGQNARMIAQLERELGETREYVQSIREQHESVNEELQASNEEITSANEELQSINEELETSKEELESANEELTTLNEEMANRNAELRATINDLNNFQTSIHTAVLLVDNQLAIRRFTPQAEKIFNLMAADTGRPLRNTRHNLVLPDLEEVVRTVIDTVHGEEREVQTREGHWYVLRVRPYLTLDKKVEGAVLVLIDIDAIKRGAQEVFLAREYAEAILRTAPTPLVVLRADLCVNSANQAFYQTFKTAADRTVGRAFQELGNGQWNDPALLKLLEGIILRSSFFTDFEITTIFPFLGRRTMVLSARRLDIESDTARILLAIEDITQRLETQNALRISETRFRRLFEAADDGILIMDSNTGRIVDANHRMTTLLEYKKEELVGKELWQIGLIKDQASSHAAFRKLQEAGFARYDNLPLETKSGEKLEVEVVANLYAEDGHKKIQCNIRDITDRKRTELELKAAKDQLAGANDLLEEKVRERSASLKYSERLAEQLIHAQEWERKRIAGELHDEIGQSLLGLNLSIKEMEHSTGIGSLASIQKMVSDIMHQVRQLSLELRPHVLDDLGLKAALEWHLKTFQDRTHITVHFEYRNLPEGALDSTQKITLFRLVQEALTNAAKHSDAKEISVQLYSEGGKVCLQIQDRGKGFELDSITIGTSSGLSLMKERVRLLGGTLLIETAPSEGTRLFMSLPVKAPDQTRTS